jgi:hypothetical protein
MLAQIHVQALNTPKMRRGLGVLARDMGAEGFAKDKAMTCSDWDSPTLVQRQLE